jgi:hypothetical protein
LVREGIPGGFWGAAMGKSRAVTTAGKTLLRLLWLDFLCIALVSLAMGGLYLVPPHRRGSRLFPLWLSSTSSCGGGGAPDGRIVGPRDISYPYGKEILTSVDAAVACLLVPIAVLLGVQVWLRSVWDASAGVLGLLKALVAASVSLSLSLSTHSHSLPVYYQSLLPFLHPSFLVPFFFSSPDRPITCFLLSLC